MNGLVHRFDGRFEFLSNFHESWFPIAGFNARSGEHAFNALKSTEITQRQWVAAAPTPGEAKRRGRNVTLRPNWDLGTRVAVMRHVVESKFAPDGELAERLRATRGMPLIEGNHWHDNFWGDCSCRKCAGIAGRNMLGELLMAWRSQITEALG